MHQPAQSPHARETLRHLTSTQALDFCSRLLSRSDNGVLTFREFHATAREMIHECPDDTALFLAALVALDMGAADGDADTAPMRPHEPCRN
jgi:hypothetical protein